MDDEERQHLEDLLRTFRRRLRPLEKQAALFGVRADPHVLNEIADIRGEIAWVETQLRGSASPARPDWPAKDPATLKRLWKQALIAFFTNDWELAESLLTKVTEANPNYKDVQARLEEARRQTGVHAFYHEIRELRDDDQWQAVLGALDELERRQPGHPDPDGLRTWARGRERHEQRYDEALAACERGNWSAAITALDILLANAPDDADAKALLARARAERQEAEEQEHQTTQHVSVRSTQQPQHSTTMVGGVVVESARTHISVGSFAIALNLLETVLKQNPTNRAAILLVASLIENPLVPIEQRLQAGRLAGKADDTRHLENVRTHINVGNFATALALLEAILNQETTNRAATLLVASLIENSLVPLELRLWAGRLAGKVGDPRPGVCTLEPAWCRPFQEGLYPIAGGKVNVRLNSFRIARYPVTVWQFNQFYNAGGSNQEHLWTPPSLTHKKARSILWNDLNRTVPNQPMIDISWYEATAFCDWLTRLGHTYGWLGANEVIRLPSEAEWEVAAMWDTREGRMQDWNPPTGEIWQNAQGVGIDYTTPVGMFPDGASASGALDMAGNVWEWCNSNYNDYPENAARLRKSSLLTQPAMRGGAYDQPNNSSSWSSRYSDSRSGMALGCGCRVCMCSLP